MRQREYQHAMEATNKEQQRRQRTESIRQRIRRLDMTVENRSATHFHTRADHASSRHNRPDHDGRSERKRQPDDQFANH